MFADTISISVNSVAKVLVRINQDNYSSEYRLRETDGEYSLKIRNTTFNDKTRQGTRVNRHNVEFIQILYPVAPSTISVKRKSFLTFEHDASDPVTGPVKHTFALCNGFLTEPNLSKLANDES